MKYILFVLLLLLSSHADNSMYEVSSQKCKDDMNSLLIQHQDSVVIRVKGLVCSSCAIGVRIQLSKLENVNKERFNNGIMLDSSNQYVVIALNKISNFESIFNAIYDAGYDPMHLCYLENGETIRIDNLRNS